MTGPEEEHTTQPRQIQILSHPQDLSSKDPVGLETPMAMLHVATHTGRACWEENQHEKGRTTEEGINASSELLAFPKANTGFFSYMSEQIPHSCLS